MSDRRSQLLSEFLVEHRPPVVEWLEQNITLPRKFSPRQPGKYSTAQRPFVRKILECWHPESGVNDCVVAAGTQLTKTTVLCLGLGYRLVHEPMPALIVIPTKEFARDVFSKERLQPLIDNNEVLSACKPDDPDKYTYLNMEMVGGTVSLVGTNSPTQLSGRPVGIVGQDECCKFEHQKSEESPEAHPVQLADERTKDFDALAFRYKSSSPNVPSHPFWQHFELGDQTRFYVPCPNCEHYFPLEFFKDNAEDGYRPVVWDPNAKNADGLWDKEKVRETAKYICPNCGYAIGSHEKPGMIERFEEHRENPVAAKSFRSFQIGSLYSPRISFGDMAVQFLKDLSQIQGLQNFYNSWEAKCWEEIEVEVKDAEIKALRWKEYRKGTIPFADPAYVILTADPGLRQTHWMVSAIERDTWQVAVVDWGTVLAPEDLQGELRAREYPVAGSKETRVAQVGLTDSNYLTERVFSMCYASGGFWWPTRGSDAAFGTWNTQPIRTLPGLEVIVFRDHTLKTELYAKRIAQLGAPRVFLPADASEGLMGQLSGQKLEAPKGRSKAKWRDMPNDHWGDCLKQVLLYEWMRDHMTAVGRRLAPRPAVEETAEKDLDGGEDA